jgi:hypothetical protein
MISFGLNNLVYNYKKVKTLKLYYVLHFYACKYDT